MSSPTRNTRKSAVALASAALVMQIGSAAAASPQSDFQQQVRRVLTGTAASPPIARPDSIRPDRLDRDTDTQAFVRRVLLGVSASRIAVAVNRPKPQGALQVTRTASAREDAQAAVRQVLLGEHASLPGAL